MKHRAVLAVDQGTTGTRAILYGRSGKSLASSYKEFRQYYPHPGWVEHDPLEIWKSTRRVIDDALTRARTPSQAVSAIGLTNQRETTVLWDRNTGKPVCPAIVWQDRRTAAWLEGLKKKGCEAVVRRKTGLVLDPYFSGSKITWLLSHYPALRKQARKGEVLFGTIDTWLIWNLTGGKVHATDYTNASRTLLFNIRTRQWDPELLRLFKVPKAMLPEVLPSGAIFGETVNLGKLKAGIPITGVMGDQQAALYGQSCYRPGQLKNTYGTGSFVVMNLGGKLGRIPLGLLATLACDETGNPVYALEGSIFISGAAIQWLRDGLDFFKHARVTEKLARSVPDSGGVIFIPSLTGLGAPYWNPEVKGVISGLTRGTRRAHLVRATLEAISHQTADVLEIMTRHSGYPVRELKADGGASANGFLMQSQADLLGLPVIVSAVQESTAWGAAKLAGRISGFWPSASGIGRKKAGKSYRPHMRPRDRKEARQRWITEIRRLTAKISV